MPEDLLPELAINALEDDARKAILVLPDTECTTLAQVTAQQESLYRAVTLVVELN